MNCCKNCFSNSYIIEWIESEGNINNCHYCESENIETISVNVLGEYVRRNLSKAYSNASTDDIPYHIYETLNEVYTVEEVLRGEEDIFSDKLEYKDKVGMLISDLMVESGPHWHDIMQGANDEFEGGEARLILKDSFYLPDLNAYQLDWEEFTYTVKHVNRFFDIKAERTREELLKRLDQFLVLMTKVIPMGYQIWRGRLNPTGYYDTLSQRIKECGPPPRNKTKSLRMSPAGISYFYGAEDIETSSKEIKDSKLDLSIYGLFETRKNLRIIDLSEIPYVSIGSIFSEGYNHDLHGAKHFLKSFGAEISKPIKQEVADIEYLPTQILTEYIRLKGYDGVRYSSSLTDGYNLTLFCGSPKTTDEDDWLVKKHQIPIFSDWLQLHDFQIGL